MTIQIKKAVRQQRKARIDLNGPSGSGKTFTALKIAQGMGKKILVIDSEQNSSSLYADEFEFDVIELPDHSIKSYFDAINLAAGYDVVIIDSLSHAWESVNQEVTDHAKRSSSKNSFQAWGEKGTPLYNDLLSRLLTIPAHLIVTMRVKSDYVMEEYQGANNKTYTRPKKVGLAPKFREGGEYEFDLVANINLEHELIVEKTRMSFLDGAIITKPDSSLGKQIAEWLGSGAEVKVPEQRISASMMSRVTSTLENGNGKRPVIPENPWLWTLQAESQFKGKMIAELEDDTITLLKADVTRETLVKRGKLNKWDNEALIECFKNEDAKLAAVASAMEDKENGV